MSADKHPAEVLADLYDQAATEFGSETAAKVADMLRRIPALEAECDCLTASLEKWVDASATDGWIGQMITERDQLRAEVEALRDDCENARELARPVCEALNIPILHDAPRAIEALQADAERIDWLADPDNTIGNVQLPRECVEQNLHSLRDAIDAARKQQ